MLRKYRVCPWTIRPAHKALSRNDPDVSRTFEFLAPKIAQLIGLRSIFRVNHQAETVERMACRKAQALWSIPCGALNLQGSGMVSYPDGPVFIDLVLEEIDAAIYP